jgi:cation diffusion facilitator CzcD-associated flavoprotein CzcO
MSVAPLRRPAEAGAPEHLDVLVVGAGISGIGAAYHLQQQTPWASYVVLEAYESFGGTWWMHRYPGVRSDSDLYTFGYRFKPWTNAPIASREEILKYMGEVIEDNGLDRHIRYRHRIQRASWSERDKRWTVEGVRGEAEEPFTFTCGFLWMCQGYYRHSEGYTPEWPGFADFKGVVVHPQTWPEDLDYKGKKVVLIGSGATAATVVPAIAADAAHVTVLQRSPTYFFPGQNVDELADTLRLLQIDETWIHEIVRRKRIYDQELMTKRCQEEPDAVAAELLEGVKAYLGDKFDAKHFTPRYRPWQQRLAFVPEGDLFQAAAAGQVSFATDHIARFTENGIELQSGETLEADIVITATGFNLAPMGDIAFEVDGRPFDFADSVTYRGMMFTGAPNLVWIFGYFRASWTLRVDLVADFVCRLLDHMRAKGAAKVEVALRPEDADMKLGPWIEPEDMSSGYLQRGVHLLPRAGDKPEWRHNQDYWREKDELPAIDLEDAAFVYDGVRADGAAEPKAQRKALAQA